MPRVGPSRLDDVLQSRLLVDRPPRIVVHLPARPADVKNVLLPQRRVLVEDGNDGPLEVPDELGRDGAPHGLATVEGVLLRDGPIEAAGGVAGVQFDLQQGFGVFHGEVLQPVARILLIYRRNLLKSMKDLLPNIDIKKCESKRVKVGKNKKSFYIKILNR